MKPTKKSVPAKETGAVAGDFSGSRNFMNMPDGQRNPNKGKTGSGPAPRPSTNAPNINGQGGVIASAARVKSTGTGPQLGVTTAPTGPHPAGLSKSQAGFTPDLGPVATKKPKKATHPFFGSNNLGY